MGSRSLWGPGFRAQSRIRPLWVRPVEGSPNASSAGFASYGADRQGWFVGLPLPVRLRRAPLPPRRTRRSSQIDGGNPLGEGRPRPLAAARRLHSQHQVALAGIEWQFVGVRLDFVRIRPPRDCNCLHQSPRHSSAISLISLPAHLCSLVSGQPAGASLKSGSLSLAHRPLFCNLPCNGLAVLQSLQIGRHLLHALRVRTVRAPTDFR